MRTNQGKHLQAYLKRVRTPSRRTLSIEIVFNVFLKICLLARSLECFARVLKQRQRRRFKKQCVTAENGQNTFMDCDAVTYET